MKRGTVTLVGAGPGDPELLTIKAAHAIGQATLLLVDDLVSDAIVALASPGARIVRVGKRGGCRSTAQAFIDKLMVTAARDGEVVVRLKGGDPFMFGRGGEEMEHLRAAAIPVSVLGGITSGIAAATATGIPLTHRDHAQGVIFITGHAKKGGPPTNWRALARTARDAHLTLVVYMGVAGVRRMQEALLSALPSDTAVAVVQYATLAQQRECLTELGKLAHTIDAEHLTSPAIIVIGEVARAAVLARRATQDADPLRHPALIAKA